MDTYCQLKIGVCDLHKTPYSVETIDSFFFGLDMVLCLVHSGPTTFVVVVNSFASLRKHCAAILLVPEDLLSFRSSKGDICDEKSFSTACQLSEHAVDVYVRKVPAGPTDLRPSAERLTPALSTRADTSFEPTQVSHPPVRAVAPAVGPIATAALVHSPPPPEICQQRNARVPSATFDAAMLSL